MNSYTINFENIKIEKEILDEKKEEPKKLERQTSKKGKSTSDPFVFMNTYNSDFLDLKVKLLSFVNQKIFTSDYSTAARKVGILYSGGMDSTLCILKELDKGNIVVPIINRFNDIPDEIVPYINLALLKQRFPGQLDAPLFSLDVSSSFGNNVLNLEAAFPRGYGQQPLSAISLGFIDTIAHNIDEFQVGYIKNDDAIAYEDDWKNLYHYTRKFTVNANDTIPDTPIVWPLKKYNKDEIVDQSDVLKNKYNLSLLSISCDNLTISAKLSERLGQIVITIEDCGHCHKCQINSMYHIPAMRSIITIPITVNKECKASSTKKSLPKLSDYEKVELSDTE